ncbi:MAG: RHS repeat-associated core domain-containing protein [Bacteroidales bacterium]|nr:RHS repeat-associated core domain-containing protein [Bacteroidales bacterium]
MTNWLVNTYDAAGERTLKLTGNFEEMNINGQYNINAYNLNTYTLYTSPYMVIDPKAKGYTKHYYIEADRFVSKIGGGMANINYNIREDHVYGMDINDPSDYEHKSRDLFEDGMMFRHFDIIDVHAEVIKDYDFRQISKFQEYDEVEKHFFFYHKDHLGSSTQISDRDANIIHHIEYMPSGEQFSEQRDYWSTPYKFNGKELDAETGLYYYGARYYTPEIGIWLSVDPLSDKYPSLSPYAYCAGNPVKYIDPNGMEIGDYYDQLGNFLGRDQNGDDGKIHVVTNSQEAEKIGNNHKNGEVTNTGDVESAVTLPSKAVRQEMGKVIGMDMKDNLREYGGRVHADSDGNPITLWAQQGPVWDGVSDYSGINLDNLVSPSPNNIAENLYTFHSHFSGVIGGKSMESNPTNTDLSNATMRSTFKMHFVFGLGKDPGSGQVHMYDRTGNRGSFPISSFLTLGK